MFGHWPWRYACNPIAAIHADVHARGNKSTGREVMCQCRFARGPVRQVADRPSGCGASVTSVVAVTLKAGGQAGSGVREAAGRE
jgi:hypothetical protein